MPITHKINQGLVIVDMQYDFAQSFNSRIINECVKEIRRAKSLRLPIFIVEYVDCGSTVEEIMDAVNGYKKTYAIEKVDDDGSKDLQQEFCRNNFSFNSLRVCGVNSWICVAETVCGLNKIYPKMKIYLNNKACGSFGDSQEKKYSKKVDFGCASGLKNVKRIMV